MQTTKDFIPTPKTESGDIPAKIKVANDVVNTTSDIIAKKAEIEKAKNDPNFTGDLKQLETDLQLLQTRISTLTKTDPSFSYIKRSSRSRKNIKSNQSTTDERKPN